MCFNPGIVHVSNVRLNSGVRTWCENLNYNSIMKKGSENDKYLVEAYNTMYKNSHKQKSKIKQSNLQVTLQRRREGNV